MIRSVSKALLAILLVAFLWIGCGCAEKSSVGLTSDIPSSKATEAVLKDLTSQWTMTIHPTPAGTPIQTPIPMPSSTLPQEPGHPSSSTPSKTATPTLLLEPTLTLDPSVFRAITIWYTRITYTYSEGGNASERKAAAELWRVQGDGSGRRKLFSKEIEGEWNVSLRHLTLSHDGSMLAFTQIVDKMETSRWSSSLWLANADASELRETVGKDDDEPGSPDWSKDDEIAFLTKERPMFPAWSPDDSFLAFVDYVGLSQGIPGVICVLNVESGQWEKLGEGEVFAWSPDGGTLAIHTEHHRATVPGLQFIDLKGGSKSVVELPPSISLDSLDWSASTQLIVAQGVNHEQPVHPVLIIHPYDGSNEIAVNSGCLGCAAKWSPDGEMILFKKHVQDMAALYVIDLDSGDARSIMSKIAVTSEGVWSPDSRYVLVQSEVEGNGLYIVSVKSGQYWKIPNIGGDSEDVWFSSYDWLFTTQ